MGSPATDSACSSLRKTTPSSGPRAAGRQDERGLVLHVETADRSEHALARHLIAEDGDGEQIGAQRQLVPGEQRARGEREIAAACLAAPTWFVRPTTLVADRAAAAWADRLAASALN